AAERVMMVTSGGDVAVDGVA
ncbi:hypothetical protein Tco_0711286, partial [Tanacetum coccineum]